MHKFGLFGLMAALFAVLATVAISSGPADAQAGNARLRVLHASPDAPNVDVYLDGAEAVNNLAFNAITDYVSVPAGSHAVKVFPASANGTGTPVIDVPSLTLDAGKDYTVAAVGTVAVIEPSVLADDNAAPAAGKAHLRVVHASPDAPNVDIFADGAGVIISDLPFKEASNYLPLNAGSYNLEVRPAGSTTAVLNLPGIQLEAGKVYTAFAVGLADGQPALSVKLTTDAVAQQATTTPAASPAPASPAPANPAPARHARLAWSLAPPFRPAEAAPAATVGSSLVWLFAGLALVTAGVAAGSLALARARKPTE